MSASLLAGTAVSTTIDFVEIPSNLQVPGTYVEIDAEYDAQGLLPFPAAACLLAPIAPTGTIAPLVPTPVYSAQQAASLLGANGIGAAAAAAFLAANAMVPLSVVGISPGGAASAASWVVTPSFTASLTGQPGTLAFYIGGVQVPVTVTPGVDTVATICTNLAAAINAALLPVTATASATTVTITAIDKGTIANALDMRVNLNAGDILPGGATAGVPNLAIGIVPTAGLTTPNLATAFAAFPSTWFTHFICPWFDSASLTAVEAEMDRRFKAMAALRARAFSAGSASSLTNLVALASGQNSKHTTLFALQNEPTPPWIVAATYAAVASFALVNDPARQLRGLILPGVVAPASVDILTEEERQTLYTSGLASGTVGKDGLVRIDRAVTTYQFADGNIPDDTWRDIMTSEAAARISYDWAAYTAVAYPRNKMAADGSLAAEYDPTIITPRRRSGAWAARSRLYEQLGWIQNSAATAAASVFYLDPSNPNRMDEELRYQLIGNAMIFAAQMRFTLNGQSSTAQA